MTLGAGNIRHQFNEAQRHFDKLIKKKPSEYFTKKVQEIERCRPSSILELYPEPESSRKQANPSGGLD